MTDDEKPEAPLSEGAEQTATGLIVYPPREGHKRARLHFVSGSDLAVDEDHHQLAARLDAFERDPEQGYRFPVVDAAIGETVYLTRAAVHEMLVLCTATWIKNPAPRDQAEGGRKVQVATPGEVLDINRAARRRLRRGR